MDEMVFRAEPIIIPVEGSTRLGIFSTKILASMDENVTRSA